MNDVGENCKVNSEPLLKIRSNLWNVYVLDTYLEVLILQCYNVGTLTFTFFVHAVSI